jgi:hypothetical protein
MSCLQRLRRQCTTVSAPHRLPQVPVDEAAAAAVRNAVQVVERPADFDEGSRYRPMTRRTRAVRRRRPRSRLSRSSRASLNTTDLKSLPRENGRSPRHAPADSLQTAWRLGRKEPPRNLRAMCPARSECRRVRLSPAVKPKRRDRFPHPRKRARAFAYNHVL